MRPFRSSNSEAVGNYQSGSDTSYVLVSLNSGMTAEVKGASTAEHAEVDQWPSNGGSNQVWITGCRRRGHAEDDHRTGQG
jgi:Ricin-type beta-trefoil lectin domain-like